MKEEELIQQYVAGTLSPSLKDDVERRMLDDMAFKSAVEEYEAVAVGIKINEKEILKKRLQYIEQEQKLDLEPKKSIFQTWKIAATIAVLLGIGSFYIFQTSNSSDSLYASNFEPYPNTLQPVVRDRPASPAFIAYENGDYTTAINEFELLLQAKNNPDIQFYLAMSLLNSNQTNAALEQLNVLTKTETRYLEAVHWYTALAHLKNDDTKKALSSLQTLKKVDASYKTEARVTLINQLD